MKHSSSKDETKKQKRKNEVKTAAQDYIDQADSLLDKVLADDFKKVRKKHSAVESGMNALENHGLDRCPDKGLKAFKRYISFAVLARNLQILGNSVQEKEVLRKKRSDKMKLVKRRIAA